MTFEIVFDADLAGDDLLEQLLDSRSVFLMQPVPPTLTSNLKEVKDDTIIAGV